MGRDQNDLALLHQQPYSLHSVNACVFDFIDQYNGRRTHTGGIGNHQRSRLSARELSHLGRSIKRFSGKCDCAGETTLHRVFRIGALSAVRMHLQELLYA